MDNNTTKAEVERSSQNARPMGPKQNKATDPKGKEAAVMGTTGSQDKQVAECSTGGISDSDQSDMMSQKSGATEIERDMRSIEITEKGFAKFSNKAQVKAFKRALNSGKTRAEALELAGKAVPGPSQAKPKATTPSFKDALVCSKVGVIHNGRLPLTTEQMKDVEKAILTSIRKMESPDWSPDFQGTERKNGWLLLRCNNQETRKWLLSCSEELAKTTSLPIKVVEGEDLPKPHMVRGFFPDSKDDSSEEILDYLRVQGQFPTAGWSIANRSNEGKVVEMVFEVDDESAALIDERGTSIPYKFSKARIIRIQGKRKASDPQGAPAKKKKPEAKAEGRPKELAEKPTPTTKSDGSHGTSSGTKGATKNTPNAAANESSGPSGTAPSKKVVPKKPTTPNVVQLRKRQVKAPPRTAPQPSTSGGTRGAKGPKSNQRQSLITESLAKK